MSKLVAPVGKMHGVFALLLAMTQQLASCAAGSSAMFPSSRAGDHISAQPLASDELLSDAGTLTEILVYDHIDTPSLLIAGSSPPQLIAVPLAARVPSYRPWVLQDSRAGFISAVAACTNTKCSNAVVALSTGVEESLQGSFALIDVQSGASLPEAGWARAGTDYVSSIALLHDGGEEEACHVVLGIPECNATTANASLGAGRVECRDTLTGSLRWTARGGRIGDSFGSSVCVVNDIDADGVSDVVIGAARRIPGATSYISLVSGRTGTAVYDMAPEVVAGEPTNRTVGAASAVSAAWSGFSEQMMLVSNEGHENRVELRTVKSGECVLSIANPHRDGARTSFGAAVAFCRDLDGDGLADIAVGDPACSTAGSYAGAVLLFSSVSGQLLGGLFGSVNDELGRSVLAYDCSDPRALCVVVLGRKTIWCLRR